MTESSDSKLGCVLPRAQTGCLADSFVLDVQTVNESANQRPDQITPNPQRSVAMFSNIERLYINGGKFIQNINNRHDHDNILKSLPCSRDAAFSAAINLDNLARRPCTKGTRINIIAQIVAWVNETDPAKAPPVYWLTGLAGLGKTTIAYTICELLDEARLPFTSFFCSLQLDSRNSKLLVTTLCHDLAELYTSYAANVSSVLETNSKVVDARLRIQIDELLAKPWQASLAQRKDLPTPIVVVDALDESDRGAEFLEELLRVIHAGRLTGIKFLVTSRPHPKIVALCQSLPSNAVCKLHEVDTVNVQYDIEKYLREALPELKDEPELVSLSQRAGGLFIYATTAVRFISPLHTPRSASEMRFHLQSMLKPGPPPAVSDGRLLVDELYERILGDAFRDAGVRATRLRIMHTILCAESRIDIAVLADLTNTDQDTVRRVVESLHAVLYISSRDGCIYWYHASFPGFVFSQERADIFCDGPARHGDLARRCFSIMRTSLHFNMCDLPSSYLLDSGVPGLNSSIDRTFSPTLRYVLRHWARHLLAVPVENDTDDLLRGLTDFLDNYLLFWIESMNLIGAKFECSLLLKDTELWLEMGKECPDLMRQLTDASNFSAFFAGGLASMSTPHLYISALSMWNQESPIWTKWRNRFRFIPSISLARSAIIFPLLTIPTSNRIVNIAISPDGNQIISGSWDRSVSVWDARTGEKLRQLQGHTDWATSVAFSPHGNRIVSGSMDKSVRVWDAKTGGQLRELHGHTRHVTSVAFSPDGNQIVSGSLDKSVRVWDAKTGEFLKELQGHTDSVASVTFSPYGNQIVSGSDDGSVRVWDGKTGEQLRVLQAHGQYVTSVTFSPDGNQIVSGSNASVRIWDGKTGEHLRELRGHTSLVTSVTFSPDGNQIVSSSTDKSLRVWDAKSGQQLRKLQGHTRVHSAAFSPDGSRIISGSEHDSVRVWDAKTSEQARKLPGHTGVITSVAFSPDGKRIVSGSEDSSVRVWDATTGDEQLRVLQEHSSVSSVTFSPDGNQIASRSYSDMWVWDANTGEKELQRRHTEFVLSVEFSVDGNRITSGSADKSVRVWNAKTGESLKERPGHTVKAKSLAFSPDGHRMVSGSHKGSLQLWDAKTGELLRQLQGHTGLITSVTFSPDGNQIVSSSDDKSVWIWDVQMGKQLRKLRGLTSLVTSVTFSPDGNRLVSGSWDKSVRVWDAKTGKQLTELRGHTDKVTSVAFSPDGNQIVSGSGDQSVRVWANLNPDAPWTIHRDGWILSGVEKLVWVPSTIRDVLLCPHSALIISRNGSAAISFEQCKLGTSWHECYTP